MDTQRLQANLLAILEIARFAPSVHNTQPWLVTVDENIITVTINQEYQLKDGDPTGRETIISLGIFCEATSIAAASFDLETEAVELEHTVVHMSFKPKKSSDTTKHLVELLFERCSDRSVYHPIDISSKTLEKITHSRKHPRVKIRATTAPDILKPVAELTSKGIQLAMSSPAFRQELSEYLIVPGSSKKRGIATKSLYLSALLAIAEPWLVKAGIGVNAEVKLEKRRWESASGVVFICSDGDMSKDWFEVGRTYLHVSLAIEDAGLSQATSAAIVEASNFHEDIEQLLKTKQRIQAIIRIGKGKTKRYRSPRVEAKELLATSN